MKSYIFTRLLFLILMFPLIQGLGCATTKSIYEKVSDKAKIFKKVYRKVRPGNAGLKKRVLVLPFLDQAGMGEAKLAEITATLVDLLNADGHLLLHEISEPLPSTVKIRSPKFGIVIDPDLAKRAEEMGMNALITVVISPFEVHSKKTGIWPFRGTKQEFEISMVVNALDITNGTLFLTNLESGKVKSQEQEIDDFLVIEEEGEAEIDEEALNKALAEILEAHASAIIDALKDQPWSGRILSADGKTIIISAGKDVGLTAESVFEVFGRGDSIRTASGRSLYLLGPKLGEIKTVKVMESHSSAVPLTGEQFRPGHVIKLKN